MAGEVVAGGYPVTSARPSPRTVVARLTARSAVRSGALWGVIFGASIASSALSYTGIYKTMAERDALAAAYGSNTATSALFGPAPQLQTVAGFTSFKISMTLMILGAVWGLLTSTRLLRGEEEAGRWELLVAGQTTRRGATVQAQAGLAGGVVVLWMITAVITAVTGRISRVDIATGPALSFAGAMVATAVMFLAVGTVTSQLGATRRQAAAYAAVFLGVSYALRMIADAGVGMHALIWVSPLGWVQELQPLTAPRPWAVVPIIAFTVALAVVAVQLAGSRDVGASIVADRVGGEPHLRLLSGPIGLAVRTLRPTAVGWWVTIGVSGLLYGVIAKSAGGTISGSSVTKIFTKLGAPGSGATAVLGVCFLILAVVVAFIGAGQLTAARAEEASGRLDRVLVAPISRGVWLGGRLLVAVVVLLVSGLFAGIFAWLGAASQHAGVSATPLLAAGMNLVPPALVIMGFGVLVFGMRPRWTSIAVYVLLGWSLLVEVVGGIGATSHWVLDTSVFHQMASAPAVSPNWATNAVMSTIGALGLLTGGLAFRRRDLQGE